MPIKRGYSKKSIETNISREKKRGKSKGQAVAIAMNTARKAWRKKHPRGRWPKGLQPR